MAQTILLVPGGATKVNIWIMINKVSFLREVFRKPRRQGKGSPLSVEGGAYALAQSGMCW